MLQPASLIAVAAMGAGALVALALLWSATREDPARDRHVHELVLGRVLPALPPGLRVADEGVRDLCVSDWFDRRPPVAWWELDAVDGDAREELESYGELLVDLGWELEATTTAAEEPALIDELLQRFARAFDGWQGTILLGADGARLSISAYVVDSEDC